MRAGALVGMVLAATGPVGSGTAQADPNCNVGIEFYSDGGFRRCWLSGNHRLHVGSGQWVVCADGRALEQYRDGRLKSCTIAEARRFNETPCKAGDEVRFSPQGRFAGCGVPVVRGD